MIRYGLGILAATAAVATVGLVACGDDIKDAGGAQQTGSGGAGVGGAGSGGGAQGGSSGGVNLPTTCESACCPTDATCYVSGQTGPGAECMALRDNTNKDHIQMRQDWIRATRPKGNTDSLVYGVLAGRSELPMKNCYQGRSPLGAGGYIQIIDFFLGGSRASAAAGMNPPDISGDWSTVGYAKYVPTADLATTVSDGFCNGTDDNYATQIDPKYQLATADIRPADLNFPPGLPLPMGAKDTPWVVGPTKAKRIAEDFDLSAPGKREELLKMFDEANPDNIKKDGFGGVFYFNEKTGYAHGYGSIGWTVVYSSDGKTHLSIPIREVETKSTFNDPTKPNCVGTFRGDVMKASASPACGSNDAKNPAWGGGNCGDHACDPSKDEASATTDGYFLITELEQLYSPDLLKTLCVSYPGADATDTSKQAVETEGFYDPNNKSCRSAKWNPTLADNAGIPHGDWCARTNQPADDKCHDAWRSHSIHVFSAANIQNNTDPANPIKTCAF
ncbi:MAG TPA: hypothetical protein VHE30_23345 [Polyangiaceae bacterium]|nr:hypothetical protein [Polyangiaceae bacterium]